jgi:hypothetical protein
LITTERKLDNFSIFNALFSLTDFTYFSSISLNSEKNYAAIKEKFSIHHATFKTARSISVFGRKFAGRKSSWTMNLSVVVIKTIILVAKSQCIRFHFWQDSHTNNKYGVLGHSQSNNAIPEQSSVQIVNNFQA